MGEVIKTHQDYWRAERMPTRNSGEAPIEEITSAVERLRKALEPELRECEETGKGVLELAMVLETLSRQVTSEDDFLAIQEVLRDLRGVAEEVKNKLPALEARAEKLQKHIDEKKVRDVQATGGE